MIKNINKKNKMAKNIKEEKDVKNKQTLNNIFTVIKKE